MEPTVVCPRLEESFSCGTQHAPSQCIHQLHRCRKQQLCQQTDTTTSHICQNRHSLDAQWAACWLSHENECLLHGNRMETAPELTVGRLLNPNLTPNHSGCGCRRAPCVCLDVSIKPCRMSIELSWDTWPVFQRVTPKAGRFLCQNRKPIELHSSASTLQEVRWCQHAVEDPAAKTTWAAWMDGSIAPWRCLSRVVV